jgi:hypothetical protein
MIQKKTLFVLWKAAKGRALTRNAEFALTIEDMETMRKRCGERCEVSGIPFNYDRYGDARTRPFAPSLDRIKASVGYTLGNCRLVCVAVNYGMGDWGEAVLKQIAAAIIGRIGLSSIQYTEDMRAVKMKGVIRRATRAGFSFSARLRILGKEYTVGTYGTPAEAHLRYLEAKKAIDQGADPLSFVTHISRRHRQSVTRELPAVSAETPVTH